MTVFEGVGSFRYSNEWLNRSRRVVRLHAVCQNLFVRWVFFHQGKNYPASDKQILHMRKYGLYNRKNAKEQYSLSFNIDDYTTDYLWSVPKP